jgi:hypothetical protein
MGMIEIVKTNISVFHYREMREWCKDNIGSEAWYPNNMYKGGWFSYSPCDELGPVKMMKWSGDARFIFEEEKHLIFFGLRWL